MYLNIILSDIAFMSPMMKSGLYIYTQTYRFELFHLKVLIVIFFWLVISAGFNSTELWNISVYAIKYENILEYLGKKSIERLVFIEHFVRLLRRYWRHWKKSLTFMIISSFSQEENKEKEILFLQWIPSLGSGALRDVVKSNLVLHFSPGSLTLFEKVYRLYSWWDTIPS